MNLEEVREQQRHEIQGIGTLRMTRDLNRLPSCEPRVNVAPHGVEFFLEARYFPFFLRVRGIAGERFNLLLERC